MKKNNLLHDSHVTAWEKNNLLHDAHVKAWKNNAGKEKLHNQVHEEQVLEEAYH